MPKPTTICNSGSSPTHLLGALITALILLPPCVVAQAPAGSQESTEHAAAKIRPLVTTVVVHGNVGDDYLPADLAVGGLTEIPLLASPVSATVVTRDLMTDQFSRVLSDVVKNDASIGEDYAPVGYYGDFQIRGFTIDLATGLQINGLVIAGEQDVPLENKERVEFLKGIAGVESGVTSSGGLINYVTKRPNLVKAADVATDHRGTAYAAFDFGTLFGRARQFGVRANIAGEKIRTYVQDANGTRGVGAGALDWKISESAVLETDFEYQHKVERSEAGYQLLGGNALPTHVYPSVMLGDQPWSKPNTFDAFNANSRLDLSLPAQWRFYMAGSYSHSLIDDNVIYPYGCYYEAACNVAGGPAPYFFAPDGSYDIYDFRSPGELRTDASGEAVVTGRLKTGAVNHTLTFGGSLFHRGVDLPGPPPVGAPSTVQNGAVYAYLGSENIFAPNVVYPDSTAGLAAGPGHLADFNRQSSGMVEDRVELGGRLQLTVGGRYASVRDFNFTGAKGVWLPQYAATFALLPSLRVYGNYNVLLSLGPQAPFWAGGFYLAPFFTRQTEIGAKFEPHKRILLTVAAFRMRAPFFYPKVIDSAGDLSFVSEGHEPHRGIELGAQGKAANWLRLSATAAGIRAVSDQTGTPAFDGKQVLNVPRLKTVVFADIAVPQRWGLHLGDLHLLPGWSYSGRKEATRDDVVSVAGYNLFNLGARFAPGGEQGRMSFRIFASNTLNKRYWKDTGASYGDTFVHLGAPATVSLSAHYRF